MKQVNVILNVIHNLKFGLWPLDCKSHFIFLTIYFWPSQFFQSQHMFRICCFYLMKWTSVQFSCSVVSDSLLPPWTAARHASQPNINSQSLLKLMYIESVMPSNHLILCSSLLLLPSIFRRNRIFSNESVLCIRWPKYWGFNFSISPSNEYSGLISFRMDWLDILAI